MKNLLLSVLLVSLSFGLNSKVSSVTVYPDRATVTRQANITIQSSGEHEYEVRGIPSGIDASSVRLSGKGSKGMRFGGIQLSRDYAPIDSGRIAEIQERLKIIDDELAALQQKRKALDYEIEFLNGIGKLSAASATSELKAGAVNPAAYEKTYQFLHTSYMNIADMTVKFGIEERKLNEEKTLLNREMRDLGHNRDKGYIARFPVVSQSAGNASVEISYTVHNASWTPGYDVRYISEDGKVEMTYYGIVRQNTGEDWENVDIQLSTSRPSLGAMFPRLNPWYLNIFRPRPPAPALSRTAKSVGAEYAMELDAMAEPEMLEDIEHIQAQAIDVGGGSIQFTIAGKNTVPADNSTKKLTVSIENFDAKESFVCVPKLSEMAYLTAEFQNKTNYPLLPGSVAIFSGNNYIGQSRIGFTAPGESVELSMGVNEAVKVERIILTDFASRSGLFGSRRKRAFAYRTTIENNTIRDINIAVHEQLPVPQDERIRIEDVEIIPKIDSKDIDRGMFKWDLSIERGKKTSVELKFIVSHPQDIDITGL